MRISSGSTYIFRTIDEKAADMAFIEATSRKAPEIEQEIIVQGGLEQNGKEIRIGDTVSFPIGDRIDEDGTRFCLMQCFSMRKVGR